MIMCVHVKRGILQDKPGLIHHCVCTPNLRTCLYCTVLGGGSTHIDMVCTVLGRNISGTVLYVPGFVTCAHNPAAGRHRIGITQHHNKQTVLNEMPVSP